VDPQEKVSEYFPKAEARESPAIFKHGSDSPVEEAYWAIFIEPDFESTELGRGRSEAEAWADAADKLESRAA